MKHLLRLCRLHYALPLSLGYLCILLYARGGALGGDVAGAVASWAALLPVIAGGYALNDVVDVEVDRWNAPRRPLAAGQVEREVALGVALALLGGGLLVGCLVGPAFAAVLAAVGVGLIAYDLTSKRLGAWKPPVVAVLVVSLYPLAAAHAGGFHGPRAGSLYVFPTWLFLTAWAYEVLKDLRDAPGDAWAARSTVIRRPQAWRRAASAAVVAGVVLALVPLGLGCGRVYLAGAAPGLLAALASPWLSVRRAIQAIYLDVFLVALAAAVDVMVLGP